jgi:HJR/Mrr/RecB family endonuclease
LSNCGTWMVGRLRTRRDRSKIEQGAADAEVEFESAARYIAGLNTGQFLIKTPSQPWSIVQERWLMSLHRPLASSELRQLKASYESEARTLLEKAEYLHTNQLLLDAENLIRQMIQVYPFSTLAASAYILLARVLIEKGDFSKARTELQQLLKRWVTDEELAEARFLLGSCYERENKFSEAAKAYNDAQGLLDEPSLKEQARVHAEYCGSRSEWPTLGIGQKLIWWITGRNPEQGQLLRLQIEDNKFLTEVHRTRLADVDFFVPYPIDYTALIRATGAVDVKVEADEAEKIKTLHWAEKQATRLSSVLSSNDLVTARKVAEQLVQKLSTLGLPASARVLVELRRTSEAVEKRHEEVRGRITQLEARQFEFEIARLLQLMGYRADATGGTGDDGVDVFARKDNETIVVQCKRWKQKVIGRSVVDELAGTALRHKASRAILATTSSFSSDAQSAATKHGIDLWDFPTLCSHFRKYNVNLPDTISG